MSAIEAAKRGAEFGIGALAWGVDPGGYRLVEGGHAIARAGGPLTTYELPGQTGEHALWRRGDRTERPAGGSPHLDLLTAAEILTSLHAPERFAGTAIGRELLASTKGAEPEPRDVALVLVSKLGFLGDDPAKERESVAYITDRLLEFAHFRVALFFDEIGPDGEVISEGLATDATPLDQMHAAARAFDSRSVPLNLDLRIQGDQLVAVPRSLLDWSWVQFGLDLAHGVRYRACKNCGAPLPVRATDERTERRETCSDACRMQLYRRRKNTRHLDTRLASGN